LVTVFSKFFREEDEMDMSLVFTSNISRFLLVRPASIVMRMQTTLAMVSPNGTATHTNLPAPIVMTVVVMLTGCVVVLYRANMFDR